MRRLFPKSRVWRGRQEARIAQRIHAHLSGVTSVHELRRRVRSIARYPLELVEELRLSDGRDVLVRPVLPSDAPLQGAFVRSMSVATRRNRFHGGVVELPAAVLRYMTEVDYADHVALVGETLDAAGPRQVAEARWVRRHDASQRADFAIAVADDCQRRGIGNVLLGMLERSAAERGIQRLCAHVLHTNRLMIGWLEARGWRLERDADDPGVVCAELPLRRRETRQWREAA